MVPLFRHLIACALLAAGSAAQAADTCEALRDRIEANIAGNGVTGFSVTVYDVATEAPGKVVGSCGNGEKKIVYARGSTPAAAKPSKATPTSPVVTKPAVRPNANGDAAAGKKQGILTECKDGTVSMGGNCKR